MFATREDRVKMLCPVCGRGRIVDARDRPTADSIRLYPPAEVNNAQLIAKCGKCGKEVGIAIAPEI